MALDYNSIHAEGDFAVKQIKIVPADGNPLDVSQTYVRLTIEEDIFNSCITGNIVISDSYDLTMLMPLVGEETIIITFLRPGTSGKTVSSATDLPETEEYDKTFRIVSLSNRQKDRERHQIYVLHFISEENINNHKVKVQKSYKNMLFSDIVSSIYYDFVVASKPIDIETTKYPQDFVVSNLSPFDAINFIATKASPDKHVGSNYVFFENLVGFNFKTMESMFEQAPVEQWNHRVSNIWNTEEKVLPGRMINIDVKNIRGYEHIKNFNILKNLISGMYASTLITYDLVRQVYVEIPHDLKAAFDLYKHCEPFKFFRDDKLDALDAPKGRYYLKSTNKDHDIIPWIAGKEPGILPTQIEEILQHRLSQLQQINNYTVALTVPGNTERTVGQIIDFVLPNCMGDDIRAGEPDKYLSGKWLITALRHRIEKNSYWLDVELVKDSFVNQIVYEDPFPIYDPLS
jgi:hypothetical protein